MPYGYDVKKPNDFNVLGGAKPIFRFMTKNVVDPWPLNQVNGDINAKDDYTDSTLAACTFSDSVPDITANNNGFSGGERVYFTGVPLPPNIEANKRYWVRNPDTNTFQISYTSDGPIIQPNAVGATTQYAQSGQGDFSIISDPGYWFVLIRMIITVRDQGSFDSGAYGNNINLSEGIKLFNGVVTDEEKNEVQEMEITTGVPIKVTPDWGVYCYDTNLSTYGQGPEQFAARWTFEKMGRPVILDGDKREYASMRLKDNFTGLLAHYFQLQGLMIKKASGE